MTNTHKLNLGTIIIFLLLTVNSVLATGAYSGKVGYIVQNNLSTLAEERYTQIIQDQGFTVDFIDDSLITSTNFSQYKFIVVGEGTLANYNKIPVNSIPSILTNTKHLSTFNWTTTLVQTSPNPVMIGRVNNQSHFITFGFPQDIPEYNTSFIGDIALSPITRAVKLKVILSHPQSTNDGVVATAENGTVLKNGFTSKAKGVFFGINKPQYWTGYSETIFRNSVIWLVTDFNAPVISGITVSNITESSAIISWQTNKNTNYTIEYGANAQLTDSLSDSTHISSRSIELTDLDEKTSYSFTIKACSANGYCSTSSVQSFTTKDITNPEIEEITVTELTDSSAVINVEASELSTYTIFYGESSSDLSESIDDNLPNAGTSFELSGLEDDKEYFFVIEVCDLSSNCINSSVESFTTLDFTAPDMPQDITLTVIQPGNKIMITWNEPISEVPVSYNIYSSESPELDSFDFDNELASTSQREFVDEIADASQEKYYIVRSVDNSGNEDSNTEVFAKYDLELAQGYNFVSIPMRITDTDINTVMHSDIGYHPVNKIISFSNEEDTFMTSNFVSSWSTDELDTIEGMNGYILRSEGTQQFTVVGKPLQDKEIEIKIGMNLVGLAVSESKPVSELVEQSPIDVKIVEVSRRNNDGTFETAYYYSGEWIGDFNVEAGVSYWLKSNQDFILGVE